MTGFRLNKSGKWLWLLLAIPALIGLACLRFDLEVLNLLPDQLPAVQGLKLYQAHFTNARELIVTLKSDDPEATLRAAGEVAQELRAHGDIVETVAWRPPWLEHPAQLAELIGYIWLNQPPHVFSELTNRLNPAQISSSLANAREQLATSMSPEVIARGSYDPLGLIPSQSILGSQDSGIGFSTPDGPFSSADGTFRVLFVQSRVPLDSYEKCQDWLATIRNVIDTTLNKERSSTPVRTSRPAGPGATDHPKIVAGYTGRPAFVAEIARGMQYDITSSVIGTAVVIAILFWIAHRRLKPLLWLMILLGLILVGTLGLGGLVFGTINIISMGFAAILLGLSVDYALVHYQEAIGRPDLSIPQVRRAIAPGVAWAAITTVTAFLSLNAAGLPGLAQLGTLVAIGVALGAVLIVMEYLPPLFPERCCPCPDVATPASTSRPGDSSCSRSAFGFQTSVLFSPLVTVTLAAVSVILLARELPRLDTTGNALRPRGSPAYAALAEFQTAIGQEQAPLGVIIGADDDRSLREKALLAQSALQTLKQQGDVKEFALPIALLPNPEAQKTNTFMARGLGITRDTLASLALQEGFKPEATDLAASLLEFFANPHAPTNDLSAWILNKTLARTPTRVFAFAMVRPGNGTADISVTQHERGNAEVLNRISRALPRDTWLYGWELLGQSVFMVVKERFWLVVGPIIALVVLSLIIAFRRAREVILSVIALSLSALFMLTIMRLAGWSWNLMNLMAIPLILGTGVDYSIFMQMALRRHDGDIAAVNQTIGKALILCGLTAIAGFGSLAFSSNAGMASLGRVCTLGIACNMLVAIVLLPGWWRFAAILSGTPKQDAESRGPSRFYTATTWRAGMLAVRLLPAGAARFAGSFAARMYAELRPNRRRIVADNLLPALQDNRAAANKLARCLFTRFGAKIADLLRYEAGLPMENILGNAVGYEQLEQAKARGRGVILLTLHLGNWELGSCWLSNRGASLKVITQTEPGADFTALRQRSRERRRIDTIVVGNDSFAFLEVIRSLEAGSVIALLVDRPPPPTNVQVNLFGRPFDTSMAAAELARATGCALIPGYIVWHKDRYDAYLLPEIPYDRASLRQKENRLALTQEMMNRFEPVIKQHLDQWFHFVPVWPKK